MKWRIKYAPTLWWVDGRTADDGIRWRCDFIISLHRHFYREARAYIWVLAIGGLRLSWGRKVA